MSKISTYPILSTPTLNDLLIGTDVENLNETKNFSLSSIGTLIGQDYVPYIGATGNVDLGVYSIEGSAFIVNGGTASQFLKADGTLDSTFYVPQTRTITINSVGYDLSANRSWDLPTIDSLTTLGTSGAATYVGKVLNIPIYQAQGNYITQLSGEATGSGPGNATVTLSNSAVISKVLTGLNITGGNVIATDTILQAFGKVQNQINGLTGGVTYQGTWNASTNTPLLQSSVGTKGYYYVVSVPGTTNLNGITDWQLGDWAIYNGTAWEKVDNTDAVVSVNGYTGAVMLTYSDVGAPPATRTLTINGVGYDLSLDRSWTVGNVRTDQTYADPSWITSLGWSKIINTPTTLAGYGITDGVSTARTLTINGVGYDLTADRTWSVGTVTSVGTTAPLTGGTITGSGTIGITQASAISDGYLSSTDWSTFNSKQDAITASAPLSLVAGTLSITQAGVSSDGYLSSTDWNTFNSKVGGSGTANYLPIWTSSSVLGNSSLSFSLDTLTVGYNSITGGAVSFTNIGLTPYTYSIQMNNFGSPRSTFHNYTDGIIVQAIASTQVSRMFDNGNFILGTGTTDTGHKLTISGDLYVNTIANAIVDTDRFIVSDGGIIKYRTGSEILSDIGAQEAITLTTVGSSGAATLIGNTLNIPIYSSSLTGYVPYTGATQDVNLGEWGISAGYFQADLTPTQAAGVGRLIWNNTEGTLNLRLLGGNVDLHIGQQQYARVVNGTGGNVLRSNYQVVKIIGAQGQRMQVGLARSDNDFNSKDTLGLIAENINNNNEGFVISSGLIEEINTTGSLQGETWTDGDTLYLSGTTFGGLTNIKPVAPIHTVIVGFVVYSHANHGKIFVKVDNGYELEELHDVNPLPYVNNGVLYRDTTLNLWKSATIPTLLGYTPANAATTITINGTTFDLSANRTWSVGTVTSVAALTLGTSGTDLSSTVSNGTTTPVITLNVPTASATNRGALSAADWSTFNAKQNALTLTTAGSSGASTLVGATLNVPTYTLSGLGGVPTSRQLTINGTAFDLSADRSWNVGTVTSVGLSSATSGVTIGSTPVIGSGTITLAIATATSTQQGLLSSTDWSTFNNKQNAITLTTTGTSGAATLVGATLNIPQYQAAGTYVTSVTASSPLASSGGTTPNITISQSSGSTNGFLSSTDWSTFNNKQNAITLTTTGTSGAATLVGSTLNIPQYQSVLTNPITGTGTTNTMAKFTGSTSIGNSALTDNGSTLTYTGSAVTSPTINVNSGNSFVAQGHTNNGGFAMNNASTYWGLMWNYAANDWRLGYGSTTAQVGWNLRWDNGSTVWANGSFRAPLFYDSDNTAYYIDAASTSVLNALTVGGSSVVTNNGGTWGINITGSAGSAGSASTASLVNGTSGGAIQSWDIRTIAPSSMTAYRLGFGFTSWANNNSAPYADYLHLRSYSDGSGGADNLVMFLKSGIGMRIYQQTFGSASAYSSYADVLLSTNYSSYALPLSGGTLTGPVSLSDGSYFRGSPSYGFRFNNNADTINSLIVDNSGNSIAYASHRAPIFYDSNNTAYYVDPSSTSTSFNSVGTGNFGNGGSDTGLGVYFGSGNSDYGRIRFYQAGTNTQTIHVFSSAWQGGTLASTSTGAINLNGSNGVTLGPWNVINSSGHWFDNSGNGQSSGSFRSPIFYDSNNTTYYLDAASSGTSLNINGGISTTASSGSILLRHPVSEANAWLFMENAPNWGLFWFNNGTQSGQTIGSYTTIGAELFGMNNAVGGFNPNSAWTGTDANTRATWMLSNYTGYIWSNSTIFAAGDMRAPIFYDSNDTSYYIDAASSSYLNNLFIAGTIRNNGSVSDDDAFGIYWDSAASTAYAIYREPGSWTYPYPDLRIAFHTGIKIGANASYQGVRFYDDYTMVNEVMSVNNGSSPIGASHVYVNNVLQAGASLRAPIFYDSDNTAFYFDGASTTNINVLHGNGKEVMLTSDSYLRINQSATFSGGTWFGGTLIRQDGFYAGSNGGTTTSRVAIQSGSFNGTNVINIDGSNGRITASELLLGGAASGFTLNLAGNAQIIKSTTSTALIVGLSGVTGSVIRFSYNGGFVGSISTDGSNTAYNTSSDYRLKEEIVPIENSVSKILSLNPVNFKYKNSKTRQDGFIAHELKEVLPYLVVGEKDAVDEDGNPVYQEVDYSKLTPILIAAIKELKTEIETLKTKQ